MNGRCLLCDQPRLVSANLGVCVECIRKRPHESEPVILEAHRKAREVFGLSVDPLTARVGFIAVSALMNVGLGTGRSGIAV